MASFNKNPILIERYEWDERKNSIEDIISEALKIANDSDQKLGVNFEQFGVTMTVYGDKTKRIPKADNTLEHYLAVYHRRLEEKTGK